MFSSPQFKDLHSVSFTQEGDGTMSTQCPVVVSASILKSGDAHSIIKTDMCTSVTTKGSDINVRLHNLNV